MMGVGPQARPRGRGGRFGGQVPFAHHFGAHQPAVIAEMHDAQAAMLSIADEYEMIGISNVKDLLSIKSLQEIVESLRTAVNNRSVMKL
jgi:hypothetical protein